MLARNWRAPENVITVTDPQPARTGPILVVIGTRPEAVKLAPVVAALRRRGGRDVVICHTGQHQELLDDTLTVFGIEPDHWLDAMVAGQSLLELQARLFSGFDRLFREVNPGTIVVQGDTASVAVASWAGFLARIEVAHVEAGLRSGDRYHPFPEEVNRRITGVTADWHFAPTLAAAENLRREGVARDRVIVTGNTVVDALLGLRDERDSAPMPLGLDPARPLLLVTAHRRENHGAPLLAICSALRRIAEQRPDIQIVIPVHPNPSVREIMHRELGSVPSCTLTPPLNYRDFVTLMLRATVALTDSGGVQEEGPCLGLPVLVMREVTERPEGVAAGSVRLVGTSEPVIVASVLELFDRGPRYHAMSQPRFVYGDGRASERIAEVLVDGALTQAEFMPGPALALA